MRKFIRAGAIAALAATFLLGNQASAGTTTVSGNTAAGENQPGWMFARDAGNAVPYEFTLLQRSIGQGSLFVPPLPPTPAKKFIAENFVFTPVADITSISWDFLMAGTDPVPNDFYINVYANIDDSTNFYDCRFDYRATAGSTSAFTTHTITPASAPTAVATRSGPNSRGVVCPATLGGMPAGSHVRMFSLNVGDTNAGDTGVAAYLDNVVLTTTAGSDVSDFEPTKDACKSGGWNFPNSPHKNQGACVSALASA